MVSSAYLRLLIFLQAIFIPGCTSSSPAFLMMYSAYKLNKQGDNIQTWRTPFPIWNQSVVPCPVLTVASDLHTNFLRGRLGGLVLRISKTNDPKSFYQNQNRLPQKKKDWFDQISNQHHHILDNKRGTAFKFWWMMTWTKSSEGAKPCYKSSKYTIYLILCVRCH